MPSASAINSNEKQPTHYLSDPHTLAADARVPHILARAHAPARLVDRVRILARDALRGAQALVAVRRALCNAQRVTV
jgi:hypothetical protein